MKDIERGKRINALINESGLKPKQLETIWSCSGSRIAEIRHGHNFSLALLEIMTLTMGWSADYILHGLTDPPPTVETATPADVMDLNLIKQLPPKQRHAMRGLLMSLIN